ncbi:MAG: hypothetical protein RH917_12720 [Lacipirellulaceae bacterium]
MKLASFSRQISCGLFMLAFAVAPQLAAAHHTGDQHIHFQKPNLGKSTSNEGLQFRSSTRVAQERASTQRRKAEPQPDSPAPKPVRVAKKRVTSQPNSGELTTKRISKSSETSTRQPAYIAQAREEQARKVANSTTRQRSYRDDAVQQASYNDRERLAMRGHYQRPRGYVQQTSFCETCIGDCTCEPGCGIIEPGCGCDPGCGIIEPGCGCEPACGIYEQTCGCAEPGCGICEATCGCDPGCGFVEPGCGCDTLGGCDACCGDGVGCGTCVGCPGDDYECIPICIPRFKELYAWAGVHGFKGPRDSIAGGPGDGNFGFQEGVNISGRAPLVGLLFPELSYQLGYQAVQSRLSGTSDGDASDRSQQFVTGGFFRRVPVGLQFGAVFDLMRDDLIREEDFHQIRYEMSLKSPKRREFGFWGASSTNNVVIGGINYESVQQYALFYRWHFRNGGKGRLWGGGTNDDEGLFGGDFWVPLNDRWSLQSGFNYLITDATAGTIGAQEESWNVGMNLVWHWGKTARRGCDSPFRPMFNVADNGWMFIDQAR